MSATCRFCDQQFANAQAVRAHLKGCAVYKARHGNASANEDIPREGRRGATSLGNEPPDSIPTDGADQPEKPFDPVHQLRQRLAAERTRLQLREVEEAHAELDHRAEAKEHERQLQAEQKANAERMADRDRENDQRVAEHKRKERERREAAENQRQKSRREIIQSVKQPVVEQWVAPIFGRSDLKARALKDIERELTALPVEELPRAELVLIAEGIRDRLYREAVQAEQRSQEQAARRQRLIQHGCDYAGRELRGVEGLSLTEVWKIERHVRDELAAVGGTETTERIEDWVDEILEAEGLEWDEEDE
jgi:hypothetical protein